MKVYTEQQAEKRREAVRKYKSSHKGHTAILRARYKYWDKHREHMLAHGSVRYAIKVGKLIRPTLCSKDDGTCKGRIEAHHDDYSKRLDVRWLCIKHHSEHHNVK